MSHRLLQRMDPNECLELLSTRSMGRLAWNTSGGIELVPVSYQCDHRSILIRTSRGSILETMAIARRDVAFETDYFDEANGWGWNVTARGIATPSVRPAPELLRRLPRPWTEAQHEFLVEINLDRVQGRRLGGAAAVAGAVAYGRARR